jgi:hypothetical protein
MKEDYDGNYTKGIKAENFFASLLNAKGIEFKYINDYYDYLVIGKHKIEVKSTSLMHGNKSYGNKNGKSDKRMGRFNFSLKEARDKIFNENIWLCFVVSYKGQFILLGLCRAKKLENKTFVSLCQIENIKLLDLDEWIGEILKEEKK